MKLKVGKIKLKQIEGSTVDDIRFKDINNGKEYDFDGYMELIKENKE
tara:strand:- start:5390 stop:5530 length:141 start_codon:yes stop_codon:yes gene_type:complete